MTTNPALAAIDKIFAKREDETVSACQLHADFLAGKLVYKADDPHMHALVTFAKAFVPDVTSGPYLIDRARVDRLKEKFAAYPDKLAGIEAAMELVRIWYVQDVVQDTSGT